MRTEAIFSQKSDSWTTPEDFYVGLDGEFHFTYDPCPIDADFNGLWAEWTGNIFINPPYSNIYAFIKKGLSEIWIGNAEVCVFLLPVRTDTAWFHDLVLAEKAEIRFIRGRLKFGGHKNNAPFPSMVVIYRREDSLNG